MKTKEQRVREILCLLSNVIMDIDNNKKINITERFKRQSKSIDQALQAIKEVWEGKGGE